MKFTLKPINAEYEVDFIISPRYFDMRIRSLHIGNLLPRHHELFFIFKPMQMLPFLDGWREFWRNANPDKQE